MAPITRGQLMWQNVGAVCWHIWRAIDIIGAEICEDVRRLILLRANSAIYIAANERIGKTIRAQIKLILVDRGINVRGMSDIMRRHHFTYNRSMCISTFGEKLYAINDKSEQNFISVARAEALFDDLAAYAELIDEEPGRNMFIRGRKYKK